MKIELHLPRSFDADVAYDPETNILTITPTSDRGVVPLIGVRAVSVDKKRIKRSVINFDLGTGEPTLQTKRRNSGQSFDDPNAPESDMDENKEAGDS